MTLLDQATRVFNRRGFMGLSFRALAAELQMSPGHLHYHFKTKAAILDAIFGRLVDRTEELFAAGVDPVTLPSSWLALQRENIFFFRELPAILLAHPALRRRYRAIARRRIAQFTAMFRTLSEVGLVIPEPVPGFYERYAVLLWHQCTSALSLAPEDDTAAGEAERMLQTLLLPIIRGRLLEALPWGQAGSS
ncbi:MAG TPA: helix-turn-helix domain-containing protein [Polyangia bacterium]